MRLLKSNLVTSIMYDYEKNPEILILVRPFTTLRARNLRMNGL
jgi:hypothetical protein